MQPPTLLFRAQWPWQTYNQTLPTSRTQGSAGARGHLASQWKGSGEPHLHVGALRPMNGDSGTVFACGSAWANGRE